MLKNNFIETNSQKVHESINFLEQFSTPGLSRVQRSVAVFFSISIFILIILTSQHYGFLTTEAEILVQNFTKHQTTVTKGITLLKYETRSTKNIDSKAEFDAETYSTGNFEVGNTDLMAYTSTDDYLELGHYGDNPPDTSVVDWWDDNNYKTCSATAFNNGSYSDTQFDGTNNWVELDTTGLTNGTGTYTSEIFDAGDDISWNTLSWNTTHPTLKDLPDNGQSEFGYDNGNSNMQNNELLLHFEESSGNVLDSSGSGLSGTVGATTTYGAAGRFNKALDFSGGSQGQVRIDDSSHKLNFVDKVSYGAWFKADSFRNWAGIVSRMDTWPNGYNLQVGTVQKIACGSGVYTTSDSMPVTGQWYHAVCVYDGTEMKLYVNGELQTDVDTVTLNESATDVIDVGDFYTGNSGLDFDGQIDEVFITHKALSDSEVKDMYRRGANRLKFQVRSCNDNACSGETFIGPDGTSSTYYTEELNDSLTTPSVILSGVADNRYFQYKAELESDISTASPELKCVSVNAGDKYNWKYRKCFDINHTASGAQDETQYQVYIDMDTASLVSAGKMKSDGSDIRFVDSDGNQLPYFIADDMNTASTRVWLQMDNIDAGTTEKVCMYYGNNGATAQSSRNDVFTYSNPEDIYYVVADTAQNTVTEFVSYTDDNDVSVSTYNNTLNQYDDARFPTGSGLTFTQTTGFSTTNPISGTYNADGTDNLVPASFASENFVYRMDRFTDYFSFISPWCDADVEVRNENNNIVTNGSFTITQGTSHNLHTSNNATHGIANNSSVMIEVTNGCPILAEHHSNNGRDSFVMAPASNEWYGVGSGRFGFAALYNNTHITVYKSNNTSSTYTLNRGENIEINDSGSEGSDPAHRVVADNLIGVSALADSDGAESTTFLPVDEMGYKYYFPEDIQYIAIATKENTTTTVNLYNNGTACGVGTPDDTSTVTASANYPGKVYFGSTTDGVNIPKGACIVANNPIFAYDEFATEDDEHNVWNEVQNKQFVSPTPIYSTSSVENGSWSIDGTHTWTRRIPVTVNNSSASTIEDYQILIDLGADASSLFGNTQSDGGDIRVAGSVGDGSDNIVYSLENYDDTSNTGKMWIKVPSISAGSSATYYIYYYPATTSQKQTCSQSEFNNGTYSDTQWDNANNWVELDSTGLTNGTGQYTSEIFDAGSSATWDNFSWKSNYPTFKELPDNEGVESVYTDGNIDMTDNELLMHLNESSGNVADTSGNGFSGVVGSTTTYGASGRFNTALDFSGGSSGEVVIDDSSHPLDYTDVVSYGVWFRADSFRNWAGLLSRMSSWGHGYNLQVGTTQRIACGSGVYTNSNSMPVTGQWYHAVCVYDGTEMKLYVNGELQTDVDTHTLAQSASNKINIGEFYTNGSSLDFDGQIDEAFITHKALSDSEVKDMYRRGANRLKFQVRSCNDNACSGETFIGPDGTSSTYYTEESNKTLGFPNMTLTNVIDNRYFQYRGDFDTDNNTISPELTCVTVDSQVLLNGFTTTGDHFAVFQTTNPKTNYYIVDERAVSETLSIISFDDGNQVNDTAVTQVVDEGDIVTLPFNAGIIQADSYSVTGPLHIGFGGDTTDSAVPLSYAGKEFVYRVDRANDIFSFYAPFADANVQIQQSDSSGWTTLQTVSVPVGTVQTVYRDIINDRVFKIISDKPILGFHRDNTSDSKILYPTHLALEEDSGMYELYGIGSRELLLGASSDANITLYRSDGTSSNIVLNASNNFSYTESNGNLQGTTIGYHIVSDVPIGASSYADADGGEAVTFLSQKEFSREYVVANPTQYMAIVARDANVTCRVYDDTGTEITTDSTGTMNNIPPQTGGAQVNPYPNNIHIGGADTSDGAYFQAGYYMICDEPVYAYYEHHLNASVTDETSWLTWPQVRKRSEIEPIVEDIDTVDEQGLYYESGFDSAGAGSNPEAFIEFTVDTSAQTYGEHTFWKSISWEEIINDRSSENSVEQVQYQASYADAVPNCAGATYSTWETIYPTIISTSVDTSINYVTYYTNEKSADLPDEFSDHQCIKVRAYLRTGDEAYSPRINKIDVNYYIPTLLEDQLNNPTINVVGATSGKDERYRVLKVITSDSNLNGSQAFLTYKAVSNSGVFIHADTDFLEIPTHAINAQFAFPPFPPSTPVDASSQSPFDSNNDLAVYFTHQRSAGATETIDFTFNVDIISAGGPQISRDFELDIGGL